MANELKVVAGTEKTLEANGGSTATGVYTAADDANLLVADVAGFPYLNVEFSGTFSVAPAAGTVIDIYARPLNFEGTNDAQAPSANFQASYVCSILLDAVTSAQYAKVSLANNPHPLDECSFYIANRTAQTLGAGWTLKVQPVTYAPT